MISTKQSVDFATYPKKQLIRFCKKFHKDCYRLVGQKMALKDRITELENEIKALRTSLDILKDNDEKIIKQMGEQIEKMKCCFNCKHTRTEYEHCRTDKHEKWEIKENEQLKAQIEKMKCCENCKYNSYWGDELHCNYGLKEALQEDKLVECKNMDKWEIKENE